MNMRIHLPAEPVVSARGRPPAASLRIRPVIGDPVNLRIHR